MRPAYVGSRGLAGSRLLSFSLTNTESTTCHTYGWPKLELLSAVGGVLSTRIINAGRALADMPTPRTVINLAPGQKAYFRIVSGGMSSSGESCPKATEMELTVPYDTLAQTVTIPGGVPACGAATVSPVLPGYIAHASS